MYALKTRTTEDTPTEDLHSQKTYLPKPRTYQRLTPTKDSEDAPTKDSEDAPTEDSHPQRAHPLETRTHGRRTH
jgi:hypothetical protein